MIPKMKSDKLAFEMFEQMFGSIISLFTWYIKFSVSEMLGAILLLKHVLSCQNMYFLEAFETTK